LRDRLAEKITEAAPNFTETYKAYGVTHELLQECMKPGEYTIPQVFEKNGEIPTDENGVHLGEGRGWWYESKLPHGR
jgi:cytochrome b pre-mRNA-processing protein 3